MILPMKKRKDQRAEIIWLLYFFANLNLFCFLKDAQSQPWNLHSQRNLKQPSIFLKSLKRNMFKSGYTQLSKQFCIIQYVWISWPTAEFRCTCCPSLEARMTIGFEICCQKPEISLRQNHCHHSRRSFHERREYFFKKKLRQEITTRQTCREIRTEHLFNWTQLKPVVECNLSLPRRYILLELAADTHKYFCWFWLTCVWESKAGYYFKQ